MKSLLTLIAVFGVTAFTPAPVYSEQKTIEDNTFNSFWVGASQASAGVICHAYQKGMIEIDQALDLIFNEYLVAYNAEIDSWDPDIDLPRQGLGGSFVESFRGTLDRIGCESLKSPNYLFVPNENAKRVKKFLNELKISVQETK